MLPVNTWIQMNKSPLWKPDLFVYIHIWNLIYLVTHSIEYEYVFCWCFMIPDNDQAENVLEKTKSWKQSHSGKWQVTSTLYTLQLFKYLFFSSLGLFFHTTWKWARWECLKENIVILRYTMNLYPRHNYLNINPSVFQVTVSHYLKMNCFRTSASCSKSTGTGGREVLCSPVNWGVQPRAHTSGGTRTTLLRAGTLPTPMVMPLRKQRQILTNKNKDKHIFFFTA